MLPFSSEYFPGSFCRIHNSGNQPSSAFAAYGDSSGGAHTYIIKSTVLTMFSGNGNTQLALLSVWGVVGGGFS